MAARKPQYLFEGTLMGASFRMQGTFEMLFALVDDSGIWFKLVGLDFVGRDGKVFATLTRIER